MFPLVSVCPQGVGMPGPRSRLRKGWVSLVPGPFWGVGMSREWVCPGVGISGGGGYVQGDGYPTPSH